ncbi:MMPL family transporter [Paractinoplanes brasiliensis]|uniref:RND superfamily putative drug exporter n=1 Tax=Paractinoplanes brasiliensis TaxID=52695 RepID=A0A4R6JMD0_9ACTN|nr:MMPL family transporter [Actinoplanes brasiliensis]TDO37299.1 RND superfamily putative drug exporter [Actinoplanes brasiliensis]GID29387.1 membrane protein [Actinoplanes brasiliensis]
MAELLYRLGRLCARRAWTVLAAWTVVLAVTVSGYLAFGGVLSSQVTIPGTATEEVSGKLADRFPSASGGNGAIVFSTTDSSAFTEAQRTGITAVLRSARELDGIATTVDPFATEGQLAEQTARITDGRRQLEEGRAQVAQLPAAQRAVAEEQLQAQSTTLDQSQRLIDMSAQVRTVSPDGAAAVAQVVFTEARLDVTPETKESVVEHVSAGVPDGVEADFSSDITQGVPEVLGVGEVAGVVIAAITLMIMLGAVVAAALPIVTALAGVGIGVTAALALSGVVEMLSITPVLGIMLGLAVGIDYCLFILNRHRRQLLDGVELHESIGLANGTSGNAVVFAGSTVLVALLALNVTGIGFLGLMGTVGAICVAVSVLLAVSLTPALLSLLGARILSRKARARIGRTHHGRAPSEPMSTGRAVLTVLGGLAVLLTIAVPALSMRLGLPDGSSEAASSTQYQAYKKIEEKFGAGVNGPLLVVADLPQPITEQARLVAEQVRVAERLLAVDGVTAVAPIGQSEDKTLLGFQVIPADGPSSSSTEQVVRDLRDLSPLPTDVRLGVAGSASGNIDISEQLAEALPGYLGLVLGLSLIILIFVFRSILVPLTATLGFILSLFATFGGITAIFQWGWLGAVFGVHDPNPVLSFLPTILIGILFGLAMDYQLFLVSGMREAYAHGAPARLAVRQGVHAGRTVVTAAAIIMIAVFGGFIFANTAIIRSLGFGLAFGVLTDAFLVRMLLIPAVMHLLGRSAWWIPRRLDNLLPNVDVEGAALERNHPAATAGTLER